MAKKIQISRQHDMEHAECCEFAERLLDKMVDKFGGSVSSVGDDYQYNHSTGIKAIVEPRAKELNVNVKLGLLTSALAPKLEGEINKVLDKYMESSE